MICMCLATANTINFVKLESPRIITVAKGAQGEAQAISPELPENQQY